MPARADRSQTGESVFEVRVVMSPAPSRKASVKVGPGSDRGRASGIAGAIVLLSIDLRQAELSAKAEYFDTIPAFAVLAAIH
jgi:hypothetical protein